jgi:hypothetical protein
MLRAIRASEASGRFENWRRVPPFSAVDAHPSYGGFGRSYYPVVVGTGYQDETFAIIRDDEPVLIVPCSVSARVIDYFGLPINVFGVDEPGDVVDATKCAFGHLRSLSLSRNIERILIRDDTSGSIRSVVGALCLSSGGSATSRSSGFCDLEIGEEGLTRNIRKSYRSLVNWGRKNLKLAYVSERNPDRKLFDLYQNFHLQIAGRRTRSQASWDAMFDWIVNGGGELSLSWLDSGDLVNGLMVVDGTTTANYASGVSDRNHFDKPLAHWPLLNAILRSRARGMKWFDLGDIPAQGTVTDKEYTIGYFKRGFVTSLRAWTTWTLTSLVQPSDSAD